MILYLDAASPALVKRFSDTRRKHPLTNEQRDLREALDQELRNHRCLLYTSDAADE